MRYSSANYEANVSRSPLKRGDVLTVNSVVSCEFVPAGTPRKNKDKPATTTPFLAFKLECEDKVVSWDLVFHKESIGKCFALLDHFQSAAFGQPLAKDCEMAHLANKIANRGDLTPFVVTVTTVYNGGVNLYIGELEFSDDEDSPSGDFINLS